MITIINHHSTYPSVFYITSDNDVPNLPKCTIGSKAIDLVTKNEWILVDGESAGEIVKVWHKFGTSTEVVTTW